MDEFVQDLVVLNKNMYATQVAVKGLMCRDRDQIYRVREGESPNASGQNLESMIDMKVDIGIIWYFKCTD